MINTVGGKTVMFSEEKNKEEAFMLCGSIMKVLMSGQEGIITYDEVKSRADI